MTSEQPPRDGSPLILRYISLLHEFRDPHAQEVLAFVEQHKDDPAFGQRVATLNRVFALTRSRDDGPLR